MYKLKDCYDVEVLRKYGFKPLKEWPDDAGCIELDEAENYEEFWLLPMDDDGENVEVYDGLPPWKIRVNERKGNWLDIACFPEGTYHIENDEMEEMFYRLYQLIRDGIIYDDYSWD